METMGCKTFLPPPPIVLVAGEVPRGHGKKISKGFYYPETAVFSSHLMNPKEVHLV